MDRHRKKQELALHNQHNSLLLSLQQIFSTILPSRLTAFVTLLHLLCVDNDIIVRRIDILQLGQMQHQSPTSPQIISYFEPPTANLTSTSQSLQLLPSHCCLCIFFALWSLKPAKKFWSRDPVSTRVGGADRF